MKKCGELNGFTIWVPGNTDIIMKEELWGHVSSKPADITPNCNTCDCLLSCGISDKVKYCSNYTPA